MATPASKARMDTTDREARERLDDAHSQHRLPGHRGQPDGQSRNAHREGGRARRDRVELRQPARRRVGHVHGLRHEEQDGARHRDELRGLRPALSADRAQPGSAAARERATPNRSARSPVYNTFGTIKGTEKPNEYILLSAHFDSWDGSQGATDNGTGTITMMEAMRILKTGVSASEAHDHGRPLAGRRAGTHRLARVRVRPSGDRASDSGRIQPGQRHRTHPEHVGRRTAERRRTHAGLARQAAAGISAADSLHRRRRAGHRAEPTTRRSTATARRCSDSARSTGTTARTRTTPIATASTRSCSTISRGTRRSSRCSRISRPRIRRSSRASEPTSRPAAAGVVAGRWRRAWCAEWTRRAFRSSAGVSAAAGGGRRRSRQRLDEKGWGPTCPKAPRFFNDTSRVTAPSNRP